MKNNDFMKKIVKFLKNKNTVTILGVVLCVIILYIAYNYRVKQAINPTLVAVSNVDIQPRTLITDEMVEYIQVPPAMINSNVIRNKSDIVGKYSNYNTMIPSGSMFFSSAVISEKELPNAAVIAVPEGKILFNLPVNMSTTYGNAMLPDSYIDIYYKGLNDEGALMVGKLLSNVKVLAVKDQNGKNVFESTDESRSPSYLYFAVEPELHLLLRKCLYLSKSNLVVELIPVPGTTVLSDQTGETEVSSQYLVDFVTAKTAFVPEDQLDITVTPNADNTEEKTNE